LLPILLDLLMNVLDFVALRLSRKVKHGFQKIWVLTIYGLVAQCPATANVDGGRARL
jgi:hypothetical protein